MASSPGWLIDIAVNNRLLAVTIAAPDSAKERTQGLLGPFNDDMTDDLTTRDGTIVPSDSDLQTIHEEFGETCKQL